MSTKDPTNKEKIEKKALQDMLFDPLSDINLRLLASHVAQLQGMHPDNRPLLVRIYRDEEKRRDGPKIWRAIFPND